MVYNNVSNLAKLFEEIRNEVRKHISFSIDDMNAGQLSHLLEKIFNTDDITFYKSGYICIETENEIIYFAHSEISGGVIANVFPQSTENNKMKPEGIIDPDSEEPETIIMERISNFSNDELKKNIL